MSSSQSPFLTVLSTPSPFLIWSLSPYSAQSTSWQTIIYLCYLFDSLDFKSRVLTDLFTSVFLAPKIVLSTLELTNNPNTDWMSKYTHWTSTAEASKKWRVNHLSIYLHDFQESFQQTGTSVINYRPPIFFCCRLLKCIFQKTLTPVLTYYFFKVHNHLTKQKEMTAYR